MLFNDHSQLEGLHAFLGASKYGWINWSDEIFEQRYYSQFASQLGVAIHELAKDSIKSRIKLTKQDRHLIEMTLYRNGIPRGAYDSEVILTNLMPFVNDAIGFHMTPEVILYYSNSAFGTADAIAFNEKEKKLRIHDLKTGSVASRIEQLMIYAALFCLEYRMKPADFTTELRIYQNFEVLIHTPEPLEIEKFMFMIRTRNDVVKKYQERDFR